jgi:exosortase
VALSLGVYGPILYYMVQHWNAVADYSHGFLIAPMAIYFAWERKPRLRRARIQPSWWGLVPLALSTLTLMVGRLGVELMNMRVSFVLALIGIVLLLLGRQIFRILAFPLCFLFLMIPLPQSLVNVVAFPLQLTAADWAVDALYYLRIPALREGNIIHLPNTTLFVAEACSGLRSLMALVTLGVVFAYFFRKSWGERIVIVLSAIPIAIIVNALRVTITGILTYRFGEKAAEGAIHEFQGLITFGAAFVLLLTEAWLLSKLWPERWRPKPVRKPAPRPPPSGVAAVPTLAVPPQSDAP